MTQPKSVTQNFLKHLILVGVVAGTLGVRSTGSGPLVAAGESSISEAGTAQTYKASPLQGVSSCAATACHGDNGPKGSKRSEYLTWFTYDKHASAYSVLLTKRSQLIEKNYCGHKDLEQAHPETDT